MTEINIILTIQYALAVAVIWCAWMFPAYLARQNKIDGIGMINIRIASWLFGWTIICWFVGLYLATKK